MFRPRLPQGRQASRKGLLAVNGGVFVMPLTRFLAAGKLDDDFAFDDFACSLNDEVEQFLKRKAAQSERLGASRTYLVFRDDLLLGYFTLLLKAFTIDDQQLSSANRRLIQRFSRFDKDSGKYSAAVYLIAQIGKNTNVEKDCAIRGSDLLELAYEKLRVAQKTVGGKLVLIEREGDREKLLQFYKANGFKSWNSRYDENDRITYDQMIRVLDPISESSSGIGS